MYTNLFIPFEEHDFVHHKENNGPSQEQLNEHRGHFNKQCQLVFDILMSGEAICTKTAITRYSIMDIRRRIKDLKDSGVKISERPLPGAKGCKEWYMSESDKLTNKYTYMTWQGPQKKD